MYKISRMVELTKEQKRKNWWYYHKWHVVIGLILLLILASGEGSTASYTAASAARLIGDLESCDSFLFLLEDPENFQKNYQILSHPDGSLPTGYENSFEDCYICWSDCPALTALDLGSYKAEILGETVTGSSQELLGRLYIARRGFWSDKTVKYPEACLDLWKTLMEGVLS